MAKPRGICVNCQVEMRPHRIGVPVITMFGKPPKPYELGFGDEYQCPGCQHITVSAHSFSEWPWRRHHDPDFEKELQHALRIAFGKNVKPVYVYENFLDVPGKEPRSRVLLRQAREKGKIR